MNNDKVNEALRECQRSIDIQDAIPHIVKSGPAVRKQYPMSYAEKIGHVRWMIAEAAAWPTSRLEKKFRWLGFIQGVLWAEGIQSIEEAKKQNMPADATFDEAPHDISEMMDVENGD